MSWEDQGRQYHEWFSHGTAPPKLKTPVEKAPAPAPDSLPARLTAVIHGALGALKRSARAQAESQLRAGLLPRLTEAMTAWAQGSRLDAHSFAYHFFHRDAADAVVTSLHDAAVGAATATRQDELAAASKHLADAMTSEGLDTWPRFVTHALERARNPATLAAVTKSLQPVLRVSAAVGKAASGSAGSGTKLAGGAEEFPFQELMESHPGILPQGGGAMPDVGAPAPGGDPVPPPAATPEVMPPTRPGELAPSVPSAKAAPENPTAPTAVPRGLPPEGVSPPGIDPRDLTPGPASRSSEQAKGGQSLYDKSGGEWRYFPGDSRHNAHWDYKPGGSPNSGWQNIPIGNHPIMK